MDYQHFLLEINKLEYGVVSFNTYKYEGYYNFYLMVAKKGNAGLFNKIEGETRYLNMFLGVKSCYALRMRGDEYRSDRYSVPEVRGIHERDEFVGFAVLQKPFDKYI